MKTYAQITDVHNRHRRQDITMGKIILFLNQMKWVTSKISMFLLWAVGFLACIGTAGWCFIAGMWIIAEIETGARVYEGEILKYTPYYWWVILFTPLVALYWHPKVRPAADHLLGNKPHSR